MKVAGLSTTTKETHCITVISQIYGSIKLLAAELFFFLILAHPVNKM